VTSGFRRFKIPDLYRFVISGLRRFKIPDLHGFLTSGLRRFKIPDLYRFVIGFAGSRFQIFTESIILKTHFTNFVKLDVWRVTCFS
jgi:hypothetical protein